MVEKKNIYLLLFYILFSFHGFSQFYIERDVFGACGQVDYLLNNKIVDYTVGEPITETFSVQISSTTRYATQGFNQPGLFKFAVNSTNSISGLGIEEWELNDFVLYPNPNSGEFIFEISENIYLDKQNYTIYDQIGRVVKVGHFKHLSNHIRMNPVPGSYYLKMDSIDLRIPFIIY